jgi:hypothetical protein
MLAFPDTRPQRRREPEPDAGAEHPLDREGREGGIAARRAARSEDRFDPTPDEAGQRYLRGRLKAGGAIWIVVVPDDEDVPATDFGSDS